MGVVREKVKEPYQHHCPPRMTTGPPRGLQQRFNMVGRETDQPVTKEINKQTT